MSGMLNQPIQAAPAPAPVMPQPRQMVVPNFPINFQPMNIGQGFGAARFLTGNVGIPLNFNVPEVAYSQSPFVPGSFEQFKAGLDFGDPKNPVIPAYNQATGSYESPKQTSFYGDSNII